MRTLKALKNNILATLMAAIILTTIGYRVAQLENGVVVEEQLNTPALNDLAAADWPAV